MAYLTTQMQVLAAGTNLALIELATEINAVMIDQWKNNQNQMKK